MTPSDLTEKLVTQALLILCKSKAILERFSADKK